MKNIRISDVTMKQRTGEISLSFKEKIELSKLLDKLGVSVIELEGITSPKIDALRIKSIAMAVTGSRVRHSVSASITAKSRFIISIPPFPRMEYLYLTKL